MFTYIGLVQLTEQGREHLEKAPEYLAKIAEFGDLRQLLTEEREAVEEIGQRGSVGRGGSAEAGGEPARFSCRDELVSIEVSQWCEAELRLADQFRKDASRPEGYERAENGVL